MKKLIEVGVDITALSQSSAAIVSGDLVMHVKIPIKAGLCD